MFSYLNKLCFSKIKKKVPNYEAILKWLIKLVIEVFEDELYLEVAVAEEGEGEEEEDQ
ncbi:MAG: hypothetical protein MJY84_06035 [Bacteroidales bacterium]|nr:hypothetical protein [Bacteroidales bacterium]